MPTKVHRVKSVVFPGVVYGRESWTMKKTEHKRTDALELLCWRRLSRVPYGRYLLTPEVFEYLAPSNTGLDGELWTVDAITKLAENGPVLVAKSSGKWMTTGDPKNYFMTLLEYVLDNTDYTDEVRELCYNRTKEK